MAGLFGGMFDFNRDGNMSTLERIKSIGFSAGENPLEQTENISLNTTLMENLILFTVGDWSQQTRCR